MIYGLDLLGAAQYKKVALRAFPQGWALGVFSSTFGDSREIVDRLLGDGRAVKARVHLLWKDNHMFAGPELKQVFREAKKWKIISQKYPNRLEVSPFCEHNAKLTEIFFQNLQNELPDARMVNTPWKGFVSKEFKNEVHGVQHSIPRDAYNFSFDGEDCVDTNVQAAKERFHDCDYFFFWHHSFNGRTRSDDTTPRHKRTGWPTVKLIESIVALGAEYHPEPAQRNLPKNWLYKSHAENVGDPKRDYHPVIIAPRKMKEVLLHGFGAGAQIARFPYYGPFADGRHRYYSRVWGYELARIAQEKTGTPLCGVHDERGDWIGYIHPAFRCGSFR